MKLQRIEKPGKPKKVVLSLPENELSDIKQYAAFYKHTYGDDVKENGNYSAALRQLP